MKEIKNPTIAWFLTIFMGTTGAHKYYIGNFRGGHIRLILFMSEILITILSYGLNARYNITAIASDSPDYYLVNIELVFIGLFILLAIIILLLLYHDIQNLAYELHIANGGTNATYFTNTTIGRNTEISNNLGSLLLLIIGIVISLTGVGAVIGLPMVGLSVILNKINTRIQRNKGGCLTRLISYVILPFYMLAFLLVLAFIFYGVEVFEKI